MAEDKITIDDLARMVKKGFDGVDEQFKRVDGQFKRVDERFNRVDERLQHIDRRLDMIERDPQELKEERVIRDEIEDLQVRVELVEKRLGIVS